MSRFFPVVSFLALVAATPARAQVVASLEDEANDVAYHKPGDSEIVDGDFDLRRFEVRIDGDDVVFKVTLGAPFRKPEVTARSTVTPVPLWNEIYLQNIDVYIDRDRAAGVGSSVCIPGRRVGFAGGRTWEVAVVLTPQPGPAAAIVRDALGQAGPHVVFPSGLRTQGRTVTARVPAAVLGGKPQKGWGYSVHVSGARWERSFSVVERVVDGKPRPDAFTMPVVGVAEAWAFGGAPAGTAHPQVVDVLLPPGVSQKQVLGSFDAKAGTPALIPFVEVGPAPVVGPVMAVAAPVFAVVYVSGTTVTVSGPTTAIRPMAIGEVKDAAGATIARVVVVRVLEAGLVADVLDGGEKIQRGAAVTFSR